MTVPMERDFDPSENFPSVVMDALQRMLTALGAAVPCPVRIKPGSSNTLQVAASSGQDAIGIPVDGAWRWIESATEQAGSGSAGDRDVWVCAAASDYEAGTPGETDATDRSFVLRITAVDASAPGGFARTRRVARATWDGSQWTDVASVIAGVVVTPGQVGDMKATARSTAPIGWLLCDGAAVSRSTYAALFALIGTSFGSGNGTTTFNVPDLRGRVPVGVDGAASRLAANDALGQSGGEEGHLLTSTESGIPAHNHDAVSTGDQALHSSAWTGLTAAVGSGGFGPITFPYVPSGLLGQANKTGVSAAADANVKHNNMQPFQIVNWVIKT